MNKQAPHVYVIPEDDRDRQIADGFVLHHQVKATRIQVMPPAKGWPNVLKTFEDEYVAILQRNLHAHVVMLIDFDGRFAERRAKFEQAIPEDLKNRVFVVGARDNPEELKKALRINFEEIGKVLANDCDAGTSENWNHEQIQHNDNDRQRLVQIVRPFLF